MTGDRESLARTTLEMLHLQGLTLADLEAVAQQEPASPMPTVAEQVAVVEPLYTNRHTRSTYRPGWRRLVEAFGDRRLDDVKTSDLRGLLNAIREAARRDDAYRATDGVATGRGSGNGAMANALHAIRAVYRTAVEDGLISEPENPVAKLKAPRRGAPTRRPLTRQEYMAVVDAASRERVDPWLASVIVRFVYETGARTGGMLGVRLDNLDPVRQTVTLPSEKGDKVLEQPISAELLEHLIALATERGAVDGADHVFRQRRRGKTPPKPLTVRTVEGTFERIRENLPADVAVHVTPHWLRHTANRRMERVAGAAVAERFLGHEPSTMNHLYARALPGEVAAAWSRVHGVDHPLADELDGW